MRAIFDLDDTICIHKNRDYKNAEPIQGVIGRICKMKEDGWEIVIYTSRGMISCNGDIDLIEKKNREIVEEWLSKHGVPYDELVFGKPIGDIYVDDKAMSLFTFLNQDFYPLSGGSGKDVYRMGNMVRKDLGTEDERNNFKIWLANNNGEFLHPKIHSFVYNVVYMDYIEGLRGCDITATFIPKLLEKLIDCKNNRKESFDITPHINNLMLNKTYNSDANELLYDVKLFLEKNKEDLSKEGSFCHGDLTLSNILLKADKIYTIDPRYIPNASSYLLDLAKLRMSVEGYERIFNISSTDNSRWIDEIDSLSKELGIYEYVIYLEMMHIFRLYRYKSNEDKQKVIDFALKEAELWL